MGFLLGKKPKAGSSESGNKSFDYIKDTFGGMAGQGGASMNMLGNILGLNGSEAGSQGLQDYWNSSGGKFLLEQGVDDVNSNMYARGLGNSGAAMKGLEEYRSGLASTKLDNYLSHLSDMSRLSLGAGGLISGAGQWSKGTGGTAGGGGLLGPLLTAAPAIIQAISAPEAKTKIERIGDWDDRGDGLGKYRFAYKWAPEEMLEGVMADEVAALRPKALGPIIRGYQSVNYAMLEAA